MINLSTVTLLCIATRDVEQSGRALVYSSQGINFAAVKLISPYRPADLPEWILWEYVTPFPTIDDWNRYVVYDLYKYFSTDHCCLIHADGFIVNPDSFQENWLQYDYAGSPWGHECAIAIQGGRDQSYSRVGNSVGLRSHKLCRLPSEINLEWKNFNADTNEDTFLSCHQWDIFAAHGCTKIPFEEAIYFGREEQFPENDHVTHPFVFHKWYGKNSQYPRL